LIERRHRLEAALALDKTSPVALEGMLTLLQALHEKEEPQGAGFFHFQVTAALGRMGRSARVAFPELLHPRLQGPFERSRHGEDLALVDLAQAAPRTIPAVADALARRHGDFGSGQLLASLGPEAVPVLIAILERPRGPHATAALALAEL